jgi:hypothetical protein
MPGAPFLKRHRKRVCQGVSDRFRVRGIDQQGTAQSVRGAGKPGQDEDARVIRILSGNVFFRD